MSKVLKYPLYPEHTTLEIPRGASVLTVQMQHGSPFLWARVNPNNELESREFEIFGTGHEMPEDARLIYIATFQMMGGDLVWHVFEAT